METIIGGWIEVGAASRAFTPGAECGDAWTVARGDGAAVVAVADGVGHGSEAASVARRSMAIIEAGGTSAERLLQRCHEVTRGTRGVAMSLAWVDPAKHEVSWVGVGNVAGIVVRGAGASLPVVQTLRPGMGLIGDNLPSLHPVTFRVEPGDQMVLATDGVSSDFADRVDGEGTARETAESILQRHATGRDDALVVVTRFLKWPT